MGKNEETKKENQYTKRQIIESDKYKERRDLLGALLSDGKEYSLTQVDALIQNFLKGKVK